MLFTKPYDRARAVAYARRWALSRNPLFANFSGQGGDCTNFVSQCVFAGSCVMNVTPDFGWYYRSLEDRAPAWSGVEYFFDFLTAVPAFVERNGGIGPFAVEVLRSRAEAGDVIQLADSTGDWYHTLIISEVTNRDILVCAHSDDALDRPLSSYRFAQARFLRPESVFFADEDGWRYDCLSEDAPTPSLPETQQESLPESSAVMGEGQGALPLNDRPEVIEGS